MFNKLQQNWLSSYHNLGENGVMDNIKDKVMSLHTELAGCDKID